MPLALLPLSPLFLYCSRPRSHQVCGGLEPCHVVCHTCTLQRRLLWLRLLLPPLVRCHEMIRCMYLLNLGPPSPRFLCSRRQQCPPVCVGMSHICFPSDHASAAGPPSSVPPGLLPPWEGPLIHVVETYLKDQMMYMEYRHRSFMVTQLSELKTFMNTE